MERLWIYPGLVLVHPRGSLRIVVLSAVISQFDLACDGISLVAGRPMPCSAEGRTGQGALIIGARYVDRSSGIVVRCVADGGDVLMVDGQAMELLSVDQPAFQRGRRA
jgi:hypothetical protein